MASSRTEVSTTMTALENQLLNMRISPIEHDKNWWKSHNDPRAFVDAVEELLRQNLQRLRQEIETGERAAEEAMNKALAAGHEGSQAESQEVRGSINTEFDA